MRASTDRVADGTPPHSALSTRIRFGWTRFYLRFLLLIRGSLPPSGGQGTNDHCDGREWESVEYIQDQITSGMKRGLIVIEVADKPE